MLTVDQHMRAQAFRDAIGQRDDPWHKDHGDAPLGAPVAKLYQESVKAATEKFYAEYPDTSWGAEK